MVLKLIVLAVALSLAVAQTTTTVMPEPTPTPMPTEPTTMMTTEETTMATEEDNQTAVNFQLQQAMDERSQHFYCLEVGQSRRDFPNTVRWGLWFQLPVLSYLETVRKLHLFNLIVAVYNAARGTNPLLTEQNICIAEVEQYGVSTYEESVFIKLYFRNAGGDVMNYTMNEVTNMNEAFRTGFTTQSPYIVPFLDRAALNLTNFDTNTNGVVTPLENFTVMDSVHPGCDSVSCPEGDPTVSAILLGTYVGYANITEEQRTVEVTVELLKNGIDGFSTFQPLAENPRPINFGLEAGDIVFAFFGSLLLTILIGAVVLGFFIHPFYLA